MLYRTVFWVTPARLQVEIIGPIGSNNNHRGYGCRGYHTVFQELFPLLALLNINFGYRGYKICTPHAMQKRDGENDHSMPHFLVAIMETSILIESGHTIHEYRKWEDRLTMKNRCCKVLHVTHCLSWKAEQFLCHIEAYTYPTQALINLEPSRYPSSSRTRKESRQNIPHWLLLSFRELINYECHSCPEQA
jgi:hypothetical protein